ncbi:hypothetical protein QQY66_47870 [Streptomyces sp. DG2A-72]|uniref:hypothetical protein n=1 Tax=Streptomyces sp. DG2A-72 TaxID=3051386 RepID=UPI00265BA99C|nr:hypothetical protein [Streptomyces sp. DG2A-72]MDO0939056.1 hypothetical protein [Streptomyces sp. DG2A-72]
MFTVIGILDPVTPAAGIDRSGLVGWEAAGDQLRFDGHPTVTGVANTMFLSVLVSPSPSPSPSPSWAAWQETVLGALTVLGYVGYQGWSRSSPHSR